MSYAISPAEQSSVAIEGSEDRFPVRRIYCVGRNYRAHAIEMGADPDRDPPFFFMKPADAIVENGATIPYPSQTSNLHHEIELVVAIDKGGKDISLEDALNHVWGYGVGIDLTRRDIQNKAKEMGRPWDMGKGFDKSAPCTALRPVSDVGHPDTGNGAIWIKVNGETKQESTLDLHIWDTAETINYLSGLCELQPGDLIYMGTPEGVAAVVSGDTMEGHIDGVGDLTINIA
ncbi:MAG: fumarylacetoacetate hydrolase family protein [Rhodospirillaceae bacterium]|jgi:fumarylpyruvate hydrolase|nr:fumarylacetoacetate hydrolase family protein [Rhodospirillaceae bacterium]MBT5941553.1 fumarylacetoacetate hydrolase family protein [Rhodospirillaceae bacterium]MBT7268131.1 fumarylacetoacetate hydrolase family protein [Rhodospirillaceae bacterium]